MPNIDKIRFSIDLPTKYPKIEDLTGVANQFSKEIINNIKNSQLFEMFGILPDKSYLIEGVPGTGKTFCVQAINNTINQKFLTEFKKLKEGEEVDVDNYFLSYDIGNYGTAFINEGSRIVQKFFEEAYSLSNFKPTVIVFDEADALMGKRRNSHKEDDKVLDTIMKNLQYSHTLSNIYTIMMTNFREGIDKAVLRAGRIDKKYTFENPKIEERKIILQKTINKINKISNYEVFLKYDLEIISKRTENFNNGDLVNIVEQTLKGKINKMLNKKDKKIETINVNGKDLESFIEKYSESFKENKKVIGF